MKQLAVVAHLHATVALEAAHVHAELSDHVQVRHKLCGMRSAARSLVGQPLGHAARWLSSGSAVSACAGTALR